MLVGEEKPEHPYGVLSRVLSYVTGAAEEDGFPGLAGGHGDRRDLLQYGDRDASDPTFVLERTDTGEAVRVTYHLSDVPDLGEAAALLPDVVEGSASPAERERFQEAWHERVDAVLADDDLFSVTADESGVVSD